MHVIRLTLAVAALVVASSSAIAQPLTTYPAWAACRAAGALGNDLATAKTFQEMPNNDAHAACTVGIPRIIGSASSGLPGCTSVVYTSAQYIGSFDWAWTVTTTPPTCHTGQGTYSGTSDVNAGYAVLKGIINGVAVYSNACPFGGSIVGAFPNATCTGAPVCPAGQVRDPDNGACTDSRKNVDPPPGSPCIDGLCNVGNASSSLVASVYQSGGSGLLQGQLTYNSQPLGDPNPPRTGVFGKGWKGNYDRDLKFSNTLVRVRRQSGKEFLFQPPASGNVYVPDADISDRLERLVDGGGATTGWRFVNAQDESTEIYSPEGKLVSTATRAGLVVTFEYSTASTPPSVAPSAGLLISATDPWGRALAYVYDAQGRVQQMTDPAGGVHTFTYDSDGNLASIAYPDASSRSYLYNEAAHTQATNLPNTLTGVVDENGGRFSTFQYDTQGRVVSSERAEGTAKTTLAYTIPGVAAAVTNEFGVTRTYGLETVLGVSSLLKFERFS